MTARARARRTHVVRLLAHRDQARRSAMLAHPSAHDTSHACMTGECSRCPDADLP